MDLPMQNGMVTGATHPPNSPKICPFGSYTNEIDAVKSATRVYPRD